MSDEQAHLTENGPVQPTYNEPPPGKFMLHVI